MPNYIYLKNTPHFTIKSFKSKTWKKWDAENKKMLSSETWQKDYRPMYQFVVENDDVLEISKDQLGQCLIAAFEAQKPLAGLTFEAKDNGKQGLDKRWWINLAKKSTDSLNAQSPTEISGGLHDANYPSDNPLF